MQELSAKVEEQQKKIDFLLNQLNSEGKSNENQTEALLFQNTPNPFSIDTEIKMSLPENVRKADIIIYNLSGTELKSIQVSGRGQAVVRVLRNELNPGMYIYALIADNKVIDSKRMILTK